MKPVAIFRHSATEGPGYFATYLDEHRRPWRLVKVDQGEPVPADARAFSGLAFMGGPMSVNDPLPWVAPVLALIRTAVDADVPVLGHCLGGQLVSRALGGEVVGNPVTEIGWGRVQVEPGEEARRWLGDRAEFLSFHWHGETFSIPAGAVRIAGSRWCRNQAFVAGKHLAMQCHVEMTPELIHAWCEEWREELVRLAGPSVQTPTQMLERVDARVTELHATARQLYARWLEGLA